MVEQVHPSYEVSLASPSYKANRSEFHQINGSLRDLERRIRYSYSVEERTKLVEEHRKGIKRLNELTEELIGFIKEEKI